MADWKTQVESGDRKMQKQQMEVLVTKSGKRIVPESSLWTDGQIAAYVQTAAKTDPKVDLVYQKVECEMGHIYVPIGLVNVLYAANGSMDLYARSKKSHRKFVLVDKIETAGFLPANFDAKLVDIAAKKAEQKAADKPAQSTEAPAAPVTENDAVQPEEKPAIQPEAPAAPATENDELYVRTKSGYRAVRFDELAGFMDAGRQLYTRSIVNGKEKYSKE
jgi:hypothetical protein